MSKNRLANVDRDVYIMTNPLNDLVYSSTKNTVIIRTVRRRQTHDPNYDWSKYTGTDGEVKRTPPYFMIGADIS